MAFFSCCYLWHFHWLPCSSTDTETAQGWRCCSIWSPQQSQHSKIPWSHLHLKCSPTHPLLLRQDLRNRLSIEMLQALLAITINGPKVGTPECVCQLTHMSELAFNCIRLQFMLHHAHMQVIFVNQILWFNQLICFPNGGNYISGKPVVTVFFFFGVAWLLWLTTSFWNYVSLGSNYVPRGKYASVTFWERRDFELYTTFCED